MDRAERDTKYRESQNQELHEDEQGLVQYLSKFNN